MKSDISAGAISKIVKSIAVILVLLIAGVSISSASDGAKKILSLVDYIGGDYKNAVQEGKIISEAEYDEMLEFSSQAMNLFETLKSSEGDRAKIEGDLTLLRESIEDKARVGDVESVSKEIKGKIIAAYSIVPYPENHPSFDNGKDLYARNCSQCHGMLGAGDGPLASGFNPPPANFTDPGSTGGLSPFKVYNTMNFGIEGTAMPSFPNLSDDDKWNVAFYVLSLGFGQEESADGKSIFETKNISPELRDPKVLATLSNDELRANLKSYTEDEKNLSKAIAFLRTEAIQLEKPEENLIALTRNTLGEAIELYEQGSEEAYNKAIDAYFEGFQKVEPALFSRDLAFGRALESKFATIRGLIKTGRPVEEVKKLQGEIEKDLDRASLILEDGKSIGKALSFVNSFAIIVREGLEAALIVAAVIAFLSATGAKDAIKFIHLGWGLALAAGLLTWILAQTVITISGARREIIEGVTSLIAAAVLFYVSYWLITKIEVKKWKEYIQDKVKKALTKKSIFALAGVSFFAVYREAFETVLFYQALWLQAENSQDAVVWGFLAGVALLSVLVVVIFKLGLRIPLKYFFSITSSLLYFLSFVLAGKGVRELQEAGVIGITPVDFLPEIDLLGIYPTLETAAIQSLLLLALAAAVLWLGFISRERERKMIAMNVSRISDEMRTMHETFDHIKGHIIEWKRCQDIDLEAEELDNQIKDVIRHVSDLENKLGDFFDVISKSKETAHKPQVVNKKPLKS